MSNKFYCHKLKVHSPPLSQPPIPGPLGLAIYEKISAKAWSNWMKHQILLINEQRLNLQEESTQAYLLQEMAAYFFGKGSAVPKHYQAPNT